MWCRGKGFCKRVRISFPTFALTLFLNGGLNQIMFLFAWRLVGETFNVSLKPQFFSASLRIGSVLSRCSLSLDISDNSLLIIYDILFIIDGGWLDRLVRSLICKLVSMVMFKPLSLKIPSYINKYYHGTCKKTLIGRYNNHPGT